jgi:cytochrome P450
VDILDMIDFETGSNLKLYINCFNESLRMMPPVYFSSSVAMSENVQCGPLAIRKGDHVSISMYHLFNNPNEWIEPRKFIPERFDHESQYHLTPDGKKRNPYSFSPFLGGARICIGKTFVEAVGKLVLPTLLQSFNFDFEEGVDKDKFDYPHNNMVMTRSPEINVIISDRNHLNTIS